MAFPKVDPSVVGSTLPQATGQADELHLSASPLAITASARLEVSVPGFSVPRFCSFPGFRLRLEQAVLKVESLDRSKLPSVKLDF